MFCQVLRQCALYGNIRNELVLELDQVENLVEVATLYIFGFIQKCSEIETGSDWGRKRGTG